MKLELQPISFEEAKVTLEAKLLWDVSMNIRERENA